MKNIFRIKIAIVAFITFVISCDQINEQEPQDSLTTDNFFSEESDFDAALHGAFAKLADYYSDELLEIGDIPTDNVIIAQEGRTSNEDMFLFLYNSDVDSDIGLLSVAYEAIKATNLVIANLDVLPDGDTKDNIEGQARAIRALAHFDMVRVYGSIPTESSDANASLGVQYRKFEDGDSSDPLSSPERETVQSNYTEIIDDLVSASELVDNESTEVTNSFTREAIFGLLSRVYLYNGNYSDVITAAAEVTTSVVSRAGISEVFTDQSTEGVLLNLGQDMLLDNISPGVIWSQGSLDELVPEYVTEYEFFQSIDITDIRKTVFISDATGSEGEYNAIITYLGELGQVNGDVDSKILRVAEVILNEAEAHYRLGDEVAALVSLDELRSERYSDFVSGGETGEDLWDAILFERRVELFTQYSRFFDLKRNAMPVDRTTFGEFSDGSGTAPQSDGIEALNFRFNYPIPLEEIQANPNFIQNPGYSN